MIFNITKSYQFGKYDDSNQLSLHAQALDGLLAANL